jgi:hypothetical protein
MSDKRRNEVSDLLETIWGNDTQNWNHAQHTMAEEVIKLFLETTSITESNLMQLLDEFLTQNPEACRVDRIEEMSTPSK